MTETLINSPGIDPELISISYSEVLIHIKEIIEKNIPLFRKNLEENMVTIPVDKLEHYLGEAPIDTVFYINKNWLSMPAKSAPAMGKPQSKVENTPKENPMKIIKKYGSSFEQIDKFHKMSIAEREEVLDNCIEELHELNAKTEPLNLETVIKMVEVIANTFYANYANLEDNLSTQNVKDNLSGLYGKTEWLIKLMIKLFQSEAYTCRDYHLINSIETGSHTINNLCKSLLWFIAFSLFYNEYIDKGLIAKNIRVIFKDRYLRYYSRKIPDYTITIETVVKGGFRRIDIDKELPLYAAGSLLYDIGKIPHIAYHDGAEAYDENIVKIHVLTGYNMVFKAKIYPFPVMAMAAFHHDYYGGRSGYNFANPIISKLTRTKREDNNARFFITYDEKDFIGGQALGYFPCKIIEIIDIYNALIGKKKMPHSDAFTIMKKEFITQSLKIDPLIFEIFMEFITACGLLKQDERGKIDSIIY